MSIKQKAISGLKWSFIDSTINQGIQFIVGIVLARLLSPNEFGLIGMLTFFIAISQSLIDSGFGNALIRKQNCTDEDFSTVFYFNLAIGILFYFILFFFAGIIGNFYHEPKLHDLIRVLGLVLIINSLTILQRTILLKKVNFKLQTRISLIASISSGFISILMAYKGFGVWALVLKTISQQFFYAVLLWLWNQWIPRWIFDKSSFKEMYKFGSPLMISGLIDTTYKNIYYLIIGKYFSADDLGYFTRANQFSSLPSSNITNIIQRVSYPLLSTLQDEPVRLKIVYKKMIKHIMFISFILMFAMVAMAKPMVLLLIGEKWLPIVEYMQLLSFAAVLYPLHALNLNMLNVMGRSDLFLKLEILKKILAIPVIILGVFAGIKIMIVGMIFFSMIAFFLNSYWSSRLMDYSVTEQLMDILPEFTFSAILCTGVFLPSLYVQINPLTMILIQLSVGVSIFAVLINIMKIEAYAEIKNLLIDRFKKSIKK